MSEPLWQRLIREISSSSDEEEDTTKKTCSRSLRRAVPTNELKSTTTASSGAPVHRGAFARLFASTPDVKLDDPGRDPLEEKELAIERILNARTRRKQERMIERALVGAANDVESHRQCRDRWKQTRLAHFNPKNSSCLAAPQPQAAALSRVRTQQAEVPDYSQVSPENQRGGSHYLHPSLKTASEAATTLEACGPARRVDEGGEWGSSADHGPLPALVPTVPKEAEAPLVYRQQLRESLRDRIKQELRRDGTTNAMLAEALEALNMLEGPDFRAAPTAQPLQCSVHESSPDQGGPPDPQESITAAHREVAEGLARPALPPPAWQALSREVGEQLGEGSSPHRDGTSPTSSTGAVGSVPLRHAEPPTASQRDDSIHSWSLQGGATSPPWEPRYGDFVRDQATSLLTSSHRHDGINGEKEFGQPSPCLCAPMLGEECDRCRGTLRQTNG